jgi:hypothetical protein
MNGFFDCSALKNTFCFNSSALTFQDGDITAIANYRAVGPSSKPEIYGFPSLYFEYISQSSQEWFIGLPILDLESTSLAIATVYRLSIRREGGNDGGSERQLIFDSTRSRGCAFTVGSVGNYSIFFSSAVPSLSGRLGHDDVFSFFAADPYDNLYSAVPFDFSTESAPASATNSYTPTSTQTATRPSSEKMTRTSSRSMTRAPSGTPPRTTSEHVTPTANEGPTPVSPPGLDGRGSNAVVIVVPIVVIVFAISATVLAWWYRRHCQPSDEEYQSVNESFLDMHID